MKYLVIAISDEHSWETIRRSFEIMGNEVTKHKCGVDCNRSRCEQISAASLALMAAALTETEGAYIEENE